MSLITRSQTRNRSRNVREKLEEQVVRPVPFLCGRREGSQELCNSLLLSGKLVIRQEFRKGLQHKGALMGSRMGKYQGRRVDDLIAKRDDVNVDRAGCPIARIPRATEPFLNRVNGC